NVIYPIEIGISSYRLHTNKEVGTFHRLLSPGPYQNIFNRASKIHGINPKSPDLDGNYTLIASELIEYFHQFHTQLAIFVSKEEQLAGDKKCLVEIFNRGMIDLPDNVRFITHVQLFTLWTKVFTHKVENVNFMLNQIFKQLECAQRCTFHQTIDPKFHCALSDARHTSLMELICLKHFQWEVDEEIQGEKLPKTTFVNMNWEVKNTIICFIGIGMYNDVFPSEIVFTLYDLDTYKTEQNIFYLALPENSKFQSETAKTIENIKKTVGETNEIVFEKINHYIDNLALRGKSVIIVNLKGGIAKCVPSITSVHKFLNLPILDFQKQILEKMAKERKTSKQKVQTFTNIVKSINLPENHVCIVHMRSPADCAKRPSDEMVSAFSHLFEDYDKTVLEFGVVEPEKEKEKKKIECIKVEPKEDKNEKKEKDEEVFHCKNEDKEPTPKERERRPIKTVKRATKSSTYAKFHFE
ncbi:hypothetical protein EIN_390940, partial [Entamoeba invadens IP1]